MEPLNDILWTPTMQEIQSSRLFSFKQWLRTEKGLSFADYESLWQWSVDHVDDFWESLVQYFHVNFHAPYSTVVTKDPMPDAVWFRGATLNYAEHVYHGMKDQHTAM